MGKCKRKYIYDYIVQISRGFRRLQFTLPALEHSFTVSSLGENLAHMHFATAIEQLKNPTRYPLLLNGQRKYEMRSLPDTSSHGQQWESNPRPFDLESNAQSTVSHTPTQ